MDIRRHKGLLSWLLPLALLLVVVAVVFAPGVVVGILGVFACQGLGYLLIFYYRSSQQGGDGTGTSL